MPVCSLCNKEVDKLVDSHVIPKSIHHLSTQSDPLHEAKVISNDGITKPKRSLIGVYDQFACTGCENSFGKWDEYALECFKKAYELEFEETNQYIEFRGYDYEKLKLFFISLLWKADASNNQSMFNEVDVGDKHRSALANMINEVNSGGWQDYAVSMELYKSNRPAASFIRSPAKARMPDNGARVYIFYMARFKVYIQCDQRCIPSSQEDYYLRESRKMLIPLIKLEESEEHRENVKLVKLESNKNAFS